MSLRNFIANKLSAIKNNIAALENSSTSAAEKGAALVALFGADPAFCREVGQIAFRKVVKKSAEIAQPVVGVKPVAVALAPAVQSAPKPTMPGKPMPAITAPARTLEPLRETIEQRRDRLVALLGRFISGAQKFLDFEKTRSFLTSVIKSGVEIPREQWETIFAALKKVAEIGKGYVLDSGTALEFFKEAPVDLTDNHVFGRDGMMVLVMADLNERSEDEELPNWLVAKLWILTAALHALDGTMGDFEINRVEALLRAVEKLDGPENLLGEIRELLPTDDPIEEVHRAAQVPNYALAEELRHLNLSGDNGHETTAIPVN